MKLFLPDRMVSTILLSIGLLVLGLAGTNAQSGRCPDGWQYHEGVCYWLSSDDLSWMDAWTMCSSFQAGLVELDELDKNSFVGREINRKGGSEYWIGLTDVESDGYWKWSNTRRKATYTITSWDRSEPNGGTTENCATTNKDGRWNDRACSDKLRYVCNKYAS